MPSNNSIRIGYFHEYSSMVNYCIFDWIRGWLYTNDENTILIRISTVCIHIFDSFSVFIHRKLFSSRLLFSSNNGQTNYWLRLIRITWLQERDCYSLHLTGIVLEMHQEHDGDEADTFVYLSNHRAIHYEILRMEGHFVHSCCISCCIIMYSSNVLRV